jgi:hypothetical protein
VRTATRGDKKRTTGDEVRTSRDVIDLASCGLYYVAHVVAVPVSENYGVSVLNDTIRWLTKERLLHETS